MEKIEYRYRFWYRYRPKFMVSDWYRIETKKAGIAHHYEGNSVFCGPETAVAARGEAEGNNGGRVCSPPFQHRFFVVVLFESQSKTPFRVLFSSL
jgi:hypothetical protein